MPILVKAGDTAPVVRATLLDALGAAVDLTGATVRFVMATSTTPRTVKVDAAATVVNAAGGVVEYAWAALDTNTVGAYVAEFEVTYANTKVQTFPTTGYVDVTISDDLGGTV